MGLSILQANLASPTLKRWRGKLVMDGVRARRHVKQSSKGFEDFERILELCTIGRFLAPL